MAIQSGMLSKLVIFCCSTAHKPSQLASQTILMGSFLSKCFFCYCLYCLLWFFEYTFVIVDPVPFVFRFKRGRSSAHICAEFEFNLFFCLITPMNEVNFSVFLFYSVGYCLELFINWFDPLSDKVKPNLSVYFSASLRFLISAGFLRRRVSSSLLPPSPCVVLCFLSIQSRCHL